MVSTNAPIQPHPAGPTKPLRLFIFSHPRTASNLFGKLFSEHPDIEYLRYPFTPGRFYGPEAQAVLQGNHDESLNILSPLLKNITYQYLLDKMEGDIFDAESKGKIPMLKDHSCHMTQMKVVREVLERPFTIPRSPIMEDRLLDVAEEKREELKGTPFHDPLARPLNPSIFPDRLWKTFAPVFTIRHPAKQVGSYYKASRVLGETADSIETEISTSYKFTRMYFDYFRNLYQQEADSDCGIEHQWPIVIDGDDLVNDPEGVAQQFCSIVQIDSAGVIYKWKAMSTENPLEAPFLETMHGSLGVIKNESPVNPSIASESLRWEKEWGPEITRQLVSCTEKVMPDYLYLYQYRLRISYSQMFTKTCYASL